MARADVDELVNDGLRAVVEIAVLRFPDHEAAGFLDVVAVLEAERRAFGERAVVDFVGGVRLRDRRQRRKGRAGFDIVKDGMALAKGAALGILPGHAHGGAFFEDAGEGEVFSRRPLDHARVGIVQRFAAALDGAQQLGVDGEIVGKGQQRLIERAQALDRHAGLDAARRPRNWR